MGTNVTENSVVTYHYEVYGPDGSLIESSRDGEPTVILHGKGAVIRGLETALEDREAGETFEVTIPPRDAFGERVPGLAQRISKKHLPKGQRLAPCTMTAFRTKQGLRQVTVIKVGSKMVDVDLNHPMAGLELTFKVEVVSVRDADPEEIAHGHAHGPGGHEH